ncbi:hypothetical protein KY290_005631 [Solanum tuberosum]|uniref:Uncharacterized protein n=1 Tax=Solanum tuberosum TaxID=4113 RepID=A0ABQ7WGK3_SOLTU|nr:hypothetical protein KY289_006019 [Solanum tuberosum]KAH0779204.1 hypothetical protein KY290_005631 [Solanum tuberosum]
MDKSMIGDLDSLPEADKLRMAAMIEQLQVRDRWFIQHVVSWDNTIMTCTSYAVVEGRKE